MNFSDVLFEIAGKAFTVGQILAASGTLLIALLLYFFLIRRLLKTYFRKEKIKTGRKNRIFRILRAILLFAVIVILISLLDLDYLLFQNEQAEIWVSTIFEGLLIFQFALLLDWILSKYLIAQYYKSRGNKIPDRPFGDLRKEIGIAANRTIQYIVFAFAVLYILRSFQLDYTFYTIEEGDEIITFKLSNIVKAILILLIARLGIWIIVQLFLHTYYRNRQINTGSQYAINQLLTYILYVIAALWAMDSLGIKMTVIWGGAAALLVGIGLGLQQTFNDLISGIILLFERTVEVEDMVDIDGMVGTVKRIGLRTSQINTRDNIDVIVPNSKLITENVVNWSHFDNKARFKLNVGVAYGSDTTLVKKLLLQSVENVKHILTFPAPTVRFTAFGESSLDFQLLFWTQKFPIIEDITSDLRFEIDHLFREHDVVIAFPQRDIWIRSINNEEQ